MSLLRLFPPLSSPRMAALLLSGGRVVDPANRLDAKTDLLISDGKIAALGPDAAKQAPREVERLDAARPGRLPRPD